MTQNERVLRYIAEHPGCTTMELQLGLSPFVSNPRARISDCRAAGHHIEMRKRPDGKDGYVIVPVRPVTQGETVGMGL